MLRDLLTIKSFDDIRLFYFKYKDSSVFSFVGVSLIILVSFFIIWKVVIPQTHDWFSIQSDITNTKDRIAHLQANQDLVSSLDKKKSDDDYAVITSALPFQKDYAGMIEAIDEATSVSQMRRDDYSIEVGNLSTKSAELSPQTTITVKVSLTGDVQKMEKFLKLLSEELPLSEVISIAYNNKSANVEVNFFYKFLPVSLQIPFTDPIRRLSPANQKTVDTFKTWRDNQQKDVTPDFVPNTDASSSGN